MVNFIQISSEKQAIKEIKKKIKRIFCPRCKCKHYIKVLPENRYHCTKCRYKFSLKILLGFKYSKLSYIQILKAIHCFSNKYTLNNVQDNLEVSYVTVRHLFTKIRHKLPQDNEKIFGDVITDVAYIGKKKNDNQILVSGVVNREFTRVIIEIVTDQEQATLEKFIHDNVIIHSFITTDSHASYNDLEWYGYGLRRENHSRFQLKYSCPIERVWALLKTFIKRTYHHIWKEKLPEYLVEFKARFNHREIVSNPHNLLAYMINSCSKSFT